MNATQTQSEPLQVAMVGAGMISWYHLVAWRNLGSKVKIVAVYDPDHARAQSRAKEFAISEVITDQQSLFSRVKIDALDIASPRETHAAWVEAAATRGISVLCQKPLTPTLYEAEQLVARIAGRTRLMVHENWRFRPWYRELKKWIETGLLGRITLARMSLISSGMLPDEKGNRPTFIRQPFMAHEARLMLSEVLIHHLDTMRFLCGPLRVVAARVSDTPEAARGETTAAIFMESERGAPIELVGTMVAPGYPVRPSDRLEIVGTRASAIFDDWELRLVGPGAEVQRFDSVKGYQDSFNRTISHFVHCLSSGAPFETNPTDNLETLRLVEHAYWAAGRHRPQS